MKKYLVVIIFMIILCLTIPVFAASISVEVVGEEIIKDGEKGTLTLQLTSDEEIGVVEGVLEYDSNIEGLEISTENGEWTTTYNEETGEFISLNAAGEKNANILTIICRLKDGKTSGTMKVKNIKVTTTDYEIKEVSGEISKTIKKEVIDHENQDSIKEEESIVVNNGDKTTSGIKIPNAGRTIIIIAILVIAIINLMIMLVKTKKYKEVK